MRFKVIIFTLLFCVNGFYPQDSKKITQKFFPDFDLDIPTPAFDKKKGFTKYEELISFLDTLQKNYPYVFSYKFIGESQKGKKIPMVFIGNTDNEKPRVCYMGGLHGNEPASTEGLMFFMYNILNEDSLKSVLEDVNLSIIPMANIDGYEIQDRYAANGQDLNRDQTKLTNPEMRILKKAINEFNPLVMVDFHEYKPYRVDFVKFGEYGTTSMFDCMFLYTGNLNVCPSIKETIENVFLPRAKQQLDTYGLKYHNYLSSKHKNNKVYFNLGSVSPRSSATSFALGNCISMLMEVRGVGLNRTSFKRRIFTTYSLACSFLTTTIQEKSFINEKLISCHDFPEQIVISYKKKKSPYKLKMIDVYNKTIVPIDIVLHNGLACEATKTRAPPNYYLVEKTLSQVVEKLSILGLKIDTLHYDELLEVESYIITSQRKSPALFQGFYENIVTTKLETKELLFEKGTFVVPMNQQRSNLAVETLEPEMLSGFLRFNVIEPEDISKIHRYVLNKEL